MMAFPSSFISPRPTAKMTAAAPTRQEVGQTYLGYSKQKYPHASVSLLQCGDKSVPCNRLNQTCNTGQLSSFSRQFLEPCRYSSLSFCRPQMWGRQQVPVLLVWAAHGFCRCAVCASTAAANSFHGRGRKRCFCSAVESKPFTAVRVPSPHKWDLVYECVFEVLWEPVEFHFQKNIND